MPLAPRFDCSFYILTGKIFAGVFDTWVLEGTLLDWTEVVGVCGLGIASLHCGEVSHVAVRG